MPLDDPARRAIACSWWRWIPGMLAFLPGAHPGLRVMEVNDAGNALQEAGWLPDFNDPATVGCLLALVREAWQNPYLAPRWSPIEGRWLVWPDPRFSLQGRFGFWGRTEVEALVVALEAAPEKP